MAESTISVVVSSGSNANGDWIRFEDGTQICTKRKIINTAVTTPWGNMYESPMLSLGDYAMPFISKPINSVSLDWRAAFVEAFYDRSSTSAGNIVIARPGSTAAQDYEFNIIAIGRWK